ncbi:hypothetical protein LTR82_006730 [Friedmanniomyces endolithicus]|uniref:DNL-type domain-containing protein n=1 Tax=Friedmanniomyces endolithicus TaxID=329885 RepID=A0AAN6FRT3_9PEZI|nr:hypothetical protein LTR82_006730 [Friedmanniomyces endolithicus]
MFALPFLKRTVRASLSVQTSFHVIRVNHALFRIPQRCFNIARPSAPTSPRRIPTQLRHESSTATTRAPTPLKDEDPQTVSYSPSTAEDTAARKAQEPAYEMHFTCRKCLHRSAHRITKQAYHFGTTLVTCPECKGRHLISDHLKIFSDKSITVEDLLREKGELLRKGRLEVSHDGGGLGATEVSRSADKNFGQAADEFL